MSTELSIAEINGEIEHLQAVRKRRIEKALQGVADLAVVKAQPARPFVIVYHDSKENREFAAYGNAFPGYGAKGDSDEDQKSTVLVDDRDAPHLWGRYRSMQRLEESLKDYPHVIKFLDES